MLGLQNVTEKSLVLLIAEPLFGPKTPSITTFSTMTLSITMKIHYIQHYDTNIMAECCSAKGYLYCVSLLSQLYNYEMDSR
jgi:hypothetical protein